MKVEEPESDSENGPNACSSEESLSGGADRTLVLWKAVGNSFHYFLHCFVVITLSLVVG